MSLDFSQMFCNDPSPLPPPEKEQKKERLLWIFKHVLLTFSGPWCCLKRLPSWIIVKPRSMSLSHICLVTICHIMSLVRENFLRSWLLKAHPKLRWFVCLCLCVCERKYVCEYVWLCMIISRQTFASRRTYKIYSNNKNPSNADILDTMHTDMSVLFSLNVVFWMFVCSQGLAFMYGSGISFNSSQAKVSIFVCGFWLCLFPFCLFVCSSLFKWLCYSKEVMQMLYKKIRNNARENQTRCFLAWYERVQSFRYVICINVFKNIETFLRRRQR